MKFYFCVAEQVFSAEFVGSTANMLMVLPNMAPFACQAPTQPLPFSPPDRPYSPLLCPANEEALTISRKQIIR